MRDLSEGQETWYIRLLHVTHHRGRVDHLGWRLGGEKLEHVTNCALHATERITCSCGKDRTTTMAHASSGFDLLKEMSTPPTSFSPANLSPSRQESTSSESSSDSICFRLSCSLRAHNYMQAVPSAGAHTHTHRDIEQCFFARSYTHGTAGNNDRSRHPLVFLFTLFLVVLVLQSSLMSRSTRHTTTFSHFAASPTQCCPLRQGPTELALALKWRRAGGPRTNSRCDSPSSNLYS